MYWRTNGAHDYIYLSINGAHDYMYLSINGAHDYMYLSEIFVSSWIRYVRRCLYTEPVCLNSNIGYNEDMCVFNIK
jgi:hypothetical protein